MDPFRFLTCTSLFQTLCVYVCARVCVVTLFCFTFIYMPFFLLSLSPGLLFCPCECGKINQLLLFLDGCFLEVARSLFWVWMVVWCLT